MNDTSEFVFKILTPEQWEEFQSGGEFSGSADDKRDGFIHLSSEHQLHNTWVKHFASRADVVIATISTKHMGGALQFEVSRGGEHFPHLYRPLAFGEVLSTALGASLQ